MMAVQRALTQQTWVTSIEPDGTEIPPGVPVAWFIPTCEVCQQFGEPADVWESHDVEDYDACPHQDRICGYCGESGHDHDDCPYEPIEEG